jgi:tetratricopeptide (TPR) repeat protein
VVLVYGLGGIGKSQLLGRFGAIARGELASDKSLAGMFRTVLVDWEDERTRAPAEYLGNTPPALYTVLVRLHQAILHDLEPNLRARADRAFDRYRQAMAELPRWKERLDQLQNEARSGAMPLSDQERAALAVVGARVGVGIGLANPVALAGLTPGDIGEAAAATTKIVSGTMQRAGRWRHGKVNPDEFALLMDPAGQLCIRLAQGLRELSAERPLIVFMDTYEIVQRLGLWFREVMLHCGSRVVWVLGARLEPETEAGGSGEVADFHRRLPGDRFVAMPLHRLDDAAVRQYLARVVSDRQLTDAEVESIAAHTRGVPLALSIAAELLQNGVAVETVCAGHAEDGPGAVVRAMAERYLYHAREAPGLRQDLPLIYGLALVYAERRRDPDVLRALWGKERSIGERIDELIARHDFVLTESRRLHQDVRDAVCSYLRDADRRLDIRAANERAAAKLEERLKRRRQLLPTLDSRLEDDAYLRDILGLIWHRFWVADELGWLTLLEVVPVLAVVGEHAPALEIAEWFAAGSTTDRRRLEALEAALSFDSADSSSQSRVSLCQSGIAVMRAAGRSGSVLLCTPEERRAALAVLAARLPGPLAARMTALGEVSAGVAAGSLLARELGNELLEALWAAMWPDGSRTAVPVPQALALAKELTRLVPDRADGWQCLGDALSFDRSTQIAAAEASRKAAELDPGNPAYLMDQAVPLAYAGHVEEAMKLLDAAIEVDASHAAAWSSLGYLYSLRCLHQLALECLQTAVKLDPINAGFLMNQAAALRAAKNPEGEQIEDLLREAIRLNPSSTIGWLRLAVELALRRDHHEAIEAASKGLQVAAHARRRPSALACLGVLLHVAGRKAESQARFAEAAQAWPEAWRQGDGFDAELLWDRALCELGQGRSTEAMETLAETRRALPSRMVLDPLAGDLLQILSRGPELHGLNDFGDLSRAMLGPDSPPVPTRSDELGHASRLNRLADLLIQRGDSAAAQRWSESALRIRERLLSADDDDLLASLSSLGAALRQEGEMDMARPYLERVLAVRERRLPPGHPDITAAADDLGLLLLEQIIIVHGDNPSADTAVRQLLLRPEPHLFALGSHDAADVAHLLHCTVPVGEETIPMLPVFTRAEFLMSAVEINPEWSSLQILEMESRTVLDDLEGRRMARHKRLEREGIQTPARESAG